MATTINQPLKGIRLFIMLTSVISLHISHANAQNVGIGTSNPQRKLTINNGSILIDPENIGNGTLDTAALVFGTEFPSGISSRRAHGPSFGLQFWTGGSMTMELSGSGNLGVGTTSNHHRLRVAGGSSWFEGTLSTEGFVQLLDKVSIGGGIDQSYRLRVYDGASRFGGDLHATGNVAFGGEVDNNYRLRVIGGNSRFGGDFHATGNAGIGGDVDNAYRLRVHSGNSRFGGNVTVDNSITADNVTVGNALTIGGKGSVRSNGPSSLRIGFDSKTVNEFLGNNASVAILADITDFSGSDGDVRVFVSQLETGAGGSLAWAHVGVSIGGVDATNDTALIWIHNRSGAAGLLKGTIYLTTIARD